MLAVAFDEVADHVGQCVDAGVAVFLAVGLNLHLLGELVDRCGEFLHTPAKRLEAIVHPEHLFRETFDQDLGFTETVVHKNLRCQQVALAVAGLIEIPVYDKARFLSACATERGSSGGRPVGSIRAASVSVLVIAGLHLGRDVEAGICDLSCLVLTEHALGGALDLLFGKNEAMVGGFPGLLFVLIEFQQGGGVFEVAALALGAFGLDLAEFV